MTESRLLSRSSVASDGWRPGDKVPGATCVVCGRETHTFKQLQACRKAVATERSEEGNTDG